MRVITLSALLLSASSAPAHTKDIGISPQETVRRLFLAFNHHDLNAMTKLYAANAILDSPDFCRSRRGPEGVRETYANLFHMFPDIKDEVSASVVNGDRVAVQFVAHSEKIAPPGELRLATFFVIRDGFIERDETYFDAHGQPCS